MAKKITELEQAMADAIIAWKNAETMVNFYKTKLKESMAGNWNEANYTYSDGTLVKAEYVAESVSKSFAQAKAKAKLKELLGDSYVESDWYNAVEKAAYIKVSVEYPEG